MQLYNGTNPVALWVSYSFAANYGLWPTPDVAVGADPRNAANLMAAVQSVTDRTNLLGNRLAMINVIDGSAGNSAFTASIANWNTWVFEGASVSFTGVTVAFTGTAVALQANTYLTAGKTLFVGKDTVGVGHILVDGFGTAAGSDLQAINGADIICDGMGGKIQVQNGAVLVVPSTASADFNGEIRHSGTGGYESLRAEHTILLAGGTTQTLTFTDFDVWVLDTITSGTPPITTIQFVPPSTNVPEVYRFIVREPAAAISNRGCWVIEDPTSASIAQFGDAVTTSTAFPIRAGSPPNVVLEYVNATGKIHVVSVLEDATGNLISLL
jgi:hypothetical protein